MLESKKEIFFKMMCVPQEYSGKVENLLLDFLQGKKKKLLSAGIEDMQRTHD